VRFVLAARYNKFKKCYCKRQPIAGRPPVSKRSGPQKKSSMSGRKRRANNSRYSSAVNIMKKMDQNISIVFLMRGVDSA
jgi:hypothetical protein